MKKLMEHFNTLQARKAARYGFLTAALSATAAISCFAEEVPLTAADFSVLTTAIKAEATPVFILSVFAVAIAASIGFVLAWWGCRVLVKTIQKSLKNGKLHIG